MMTVGIERIFAILLSLIKIAGSYVITNGIQGNPEIECKGDSVILRFYTLTAFNGKVYAKGRFDDEKCRREFYTNPEAGGEIQLYLGSCGMQKKREVYPNGMHFQITLVISFHPVFLTQIDRAYSLSCHYKPVEPVSLKARLDIDMIDTTPIYAKAAAEEPECVYMIRAFSLDGPEARFARLGDKVFHIWKCDNREHSILVHDCYVSDVGGKQSIMVIDSNGCSLDSILISDIMYAHKADFPLAAAESYVFKYADEGSVFFSCAIRMCDLGDPACAKKNCQTDSSTSYSPPRPPSYPPLTPSGTSSPNPSGFSYNARPVNGGYSPPPAGSVYSGPVPSYTYSRPAPPRYPAPTSYYPPAPSPYVSLTTALPNYNTPFVYPPVTYPPQSYRSKNFQTLAHDSAFPRETSMKTSSEATKEPPLVSTHLEDVDSLSAGDRSNEGTKRMFGQVIDETDAELTLDFEELPQLHQLRDVGIAKIVPPLGAQWRSNNISKKPKEPLEQNQEVLGPQNQSNSKYNGAQFGALKSEDFKSIRPKRNFPGEWKRLLDTGDIILDELDKSTVPPDGKTSTFSNQKTPASAHLLMANGYLRNDNLTGAKKQEAFQNSMSRDMDVISRPLAIAEVGDEFGRSEENADKIPPGSFVDQSALHDSSTVCLPVKWFSLLVAALVATFAISISFTVVNCLRRIAPKTINDDTLSYDRSAQRCQDCRARRDRKAPHGSLKQVPVRRRLSAYAYDLLIQRGHLRRGKLGESGGRNLAHSDISNSGSFSDSSDIFLTNTSRKDSNSANNKILAAAQTKY